MKNLLNAIQNTCIAISQKEGGKYFAFCDYAGHVNQITIRLNYRGKFGSFFTKYLYLDFENATSELQKILDQLTLFYNE